MQSLFDDENFMKTNFISAWGKSNATEDFLDNLSNFEFIKPYKLNSLVLLTKKGQRTPFGKNLPGSFKYKIEKSKPNASIYHISNIVGKEKKKMEGKVISFQKTSEISFLFSVSSSDFRNNVLLRSIYHTYPLVFQPTLKQVQLQEILNKINENLLPKRTIRIMKTTAKRWIMSENKEKKKKVGSRIDWEDFSIKRTFIEAKEEGKWFTKLNFRVFKNGDNFLKPEEWEGSISNRGVFITNKWLPEYTSIITSNLFFIAEEKAKLYENRSRKDTTSNEVRPIFIKFKENVFNDIKNNQEFISVVKGISHFGYSVIHSNPYIHLNLLDYLDGSSFEVLVHQPDRILIYPQIKASSISIEKIVRHITEEFREGDVKDLSINNG